MLRIENFSQVKSLERYLKTKGGNGHCFATLDITRAYCNISRKNLKIYSV